MSNRYSTLLLLLMLLLASCAPQSTTALPTLAPSPTPPPQTIAVWETVSGTLTADAPLVEWGFIGEANGQVRVDSTGAGVNLTLLDINGVALAEGRILQTRLPVSGLYTVRVQLFSGEASDYTMTVRYDDRPDPNTLPTPTPPPPVTATPSPAPYADLGVLQGTLTSTNPAFGAFNDLDTAHVYTFQGAQGGYISLLMARRSGDVDPYLRLYAPNGDLIAIDDNSGNGRTAHLVNVPLPTDGVYVIQATSEGFAGTYDLTLATDSAPFPQTPISDVPAQLAPTQAVVLTPTVPAAVSGGRLNDHQPAVGVIERLGAFQRFTIDAQAGEVFSVGAFSRTANFVPRIELYSPSGAVVAQADTPGPDGELFIGRYEAPVAGRYVVFVNSENESGAYLISYGRGDTREDVRRGEIFPDRTYDATITRRGVRDVWYIRLSAGDIITANVRNRDGQFDPVLEVVAPDGTRLIEDDNGGGEGGAALVGTVRAARTGLYTLRVRSADPEVFGAYSLQWRYIEAAPTPTPPLQYVTLFSVDDRISEAEPQRYPIQGRAGDELLIRVIGAPGTGIDTFATLYDEAYAVIAQDDDSGGNLNPLMRVTLPADGRYTVQVSVYNDGDGDIGNFSMDVRRVFR